MYGQTPQKKQCPICGNVKPIGYFYQSPNESHNGFLPICKDCCQKKFNQFKTETNNDGAALWSLLAEVGVPFKRDIYERIQEAVFMPNKRGRKPDLFSTYIRCFYDENYVAKGFYESDVMIDEFIRVNTNSNRDVYDVVDELDMEKQKEIWGKFTTDDGEPDKEAYAFLNRTFREYTDELVGMDANLTNRYRDLCKAEWRRRIADETGDVSEIAKAQTTLTNMLKLLKLDNFEIQQKSKEEMAFDKQVAMIELYDPAECEDLTAFLDMVGYEKDKAISMRSLQNAIAGTKDYPDVPYEQQR